MNRNAMDKVDFLHQYIINCNPDVDDRLKLILPLPTSSIAYFVLCVLMHAPFSFSLNVSYAEHPVMKPTYILLELYLMSSK